MPPHCPKQKTWKFGVGGGGWGGHLSSIPLMFPLQIPCSLVDAELIISNSCATPLPDQTERNLKESPRLLPRWAYVIGLGMNEKDTKYRGTYAQFFLSRCGIHCFSSFFSNFKPSPHSPHKDSAVYLTIEYWADSDLHCNCCAPHMGTLTQLQQDNKKMQNNSLGTRRLSRGGGGVLSFSPHT